MSIFGRGKKPTSDNAKFIMAAGRAVGNIRPPAGSGNHKGRGTKPKSAPMKRMMKGQRTESDLTRSTYKDRGQSLGQVNSGFKVRG
jgi:hypothetical protein